MSDAVDYRQFGGVMLAQGNGPAVWDFGYRPFLAPAATARLVGSLRAAHGAARFADAAPHLAGTGEGKTVILHQAAKKTLGAFLRSQYQDRGTCVSRGAKRIVDLTQCVQIAGGAIHEFKYVSHAYIYGTCREHGGDLSNEDGAVGAWAAWSVANDGNLTNEDAGDDDNADALAVKWGARGVPAETKTKGRLHLIKRVAQARSFAEVRDAICNGYGVTIASDVGYEGNGGFKRDQNGACRAGGSWAHQMCYTGYCDDLAGQGPHLLQDQSWGPDQPGGPTGPIEIPTYSFWTRQRDAERQIAQGDCWIFSAFDGWPSGQLPWLF